MIKALEREPETNISIHRGFICHSTIGHEKQWKAMGSTIKKL
jgi:hypothetical protein